MLWNQRTACGFRSCSGVSKKKAVAVVLLLLFANAPAPPTENDSQGRYWLNILYRPKQNKTKTTHGQLFSFSHGRVATIQKNSTNDQIDFSLELEIQKKTQTFANLYSSSVGSLSACSDRRGRNKLKCCWP